MFYNTEFSLPTLLPLIHLDRHDTVVEVDDGINREEAHFHIMKDDDVGFNVWAEEKLTGGHTWRLYREKLEKGFSYNVMHDFRGQMLATIWVSTEKVSAQWIKIEWRKHKRVEYSTQVETSRKEGDSTLRVAHDYIVGDLVSPLFPVPWIIYCYKRVRYHSHWTAGYMGRNPPRKVIEDGRKAISRAIDDLAKVVPHAQMFQLDSGGSDFEINYKELACQIRTLVAAVLDPKVHGKLDEHWSIWGDPETVKREHFKIDHRFPQDVNASAESTLEFFTNAEIMYRPKSVLGFLKCHMDNRVPKYVRQNTEGKVVKKALKHHHRDNDQGEDLRLLLLSYAEAFDPFRPKIDALLEKFPMENGYVSVK